MATVNRITDRVTRLSHRIFNTTTTEPKVIRDGNPFRVSDFQKNILTEDVLQTSTAKTTQGINDKISAATKRIYSTFVGSITDFGNKGIETIKEFCNKVRNYTTTTWNKLQEIGRTEITFDGVKETLSKVFPSQKTKEINKLAKMNPHTEVKPLFTEALAALQADLTAAA